MLSNLSCSLGACLFGMNSTGEMFGGIKDGIWSILSEFRGVGVGGCDIMWFGI